MRSCPLIHGKQLCPKLRMKLPEFPQLSNALERAAPAGCPVVDPIQAAEIKATGIAILQRLGFCNTPFYQRILLILAALGFIGSNPYIV